MGQSIKSDRTILGFKFNHIFNDELSLSYIPSAYISYWTDQSESSNRSTSKLFRNEIKINYKYSANVNLISGFEYQYNKVGSTIFGNRKSDGIGIYSQLDLKYLNNLNISAGLRFDNSKLEDLKVKIPFRRNLE